LFLSRTHKLERNDSAESQIWVFKDNGTIDQYRFNIEMGGECELMKTFALFGANSISTDVNPGALNKT
jgi:hypothetical protein